MNKVALLVVVYNKKLRQSATLSSLLRFNYKLENLFIVNNGPIEIGLEDEMIVALNAKHSNVQLFNYIENRPLSWVYNEFIQKIKNIDYYVLFDDDTEINQQYEKYIFSVKDIDLALPKIFSLIDSMQHYPIYGDLLYTQSSMLDNTQQDIYSIASGLIISKKIKHNFESKKIDLFDPTFALYGVDFSFFRRLNTLFKDEHLRISSNVMLNHALSSTEGSVSDWRAAERLYDEVLTIKYYTNKQFLRLSILILKKLIKLKFKHILIILKTYHQGQHPHCMAQKY